MKYYFAVGRRKTAIARARIHPEGKGTVTVNGVITDKYNKLFELTKTTGKFDTTVVVAGSGMTGQDGAVSLAIARAIVSFDPKLKAVLRKEGFMTRDPRAKERKKPGLPGARKQKSSPKR